MSKFKAGDRVASKFSGRVGTVVPFSHKYIEVEWDDGVRGVALVAELNPPDIPDGIVAEIKVVADYGSGRGVVDVKGVPVEKLAGKFKLMRVDQLLREQPPLPCPFCNSPNVGFVGDDAEAAYIQCKDCLAEGPVNDTGHKKWDEAKR